jgi:perosamine synthetase
MAPEEPSPFATIRQAHRHRGDKIEMFRSLSPAAAPIKTADLFRALGSHSHAGISEGPFCDEIRRYLGVRDVFLCASGRTSLVVALRALCRKSPRREVVIPAFGSFCLPSAVARTGLKIVLCDVDPDTLDFDPKELERVVSERTLCVIPVHLFGLIADIQNIRKLADAAGARVIEDAAQAAGGESGAKKAGTVGYAGIFSLGRGKNITTVGGGFIVTDSEPFGEDIKGAMNELGILSGGGGSVSAFLGALVLSVFLRPELYWIPDHMPFLGLGESEFSTGFEIKGLSGFQTGLGNSVWGRLDNYNKIRREKAAFLSRALSGIPGVRLPRSTAGSRPVFLRFPVIIEDPDRRERIYTELVKRGLGSSKTYPSALNAILEMIPYCASLEASYPRAQWIAARILTLPTHPFVSDADLTRMVEVLHNRSGRVAG